MQNWYQSTLPDWMKQSPGRQPFQDVLQGKPTQAFDPGGYFRPGGTETLPSYQRFNRLAPSEQQGYTGYLEDSLGVNAQDVYSIMRKLRPAGNFSVAPRWSL